MLKSLLCIAACLGCSIACAQSTNTNPVYVVNGAIVQSVTDIPEENIEKIETLTADEKTIETYGEQANNGVVLITLRFDKPARFLGGDSLNEYICDRIKWPESPWATRVSMRYTITSKGEFIAGKVLQCTDKRLLQKVRSALKSIPGWEPATKCGAGVDSEHILFVQLPKGKPLPPEPYIIIR